MKLANIVDLKKIYVSVNEIDRQVGLVVRNLGLKENGSLR